MRKVLAGTLLVVMLASAGCGGGSSPGGSTNDASNGEAGKPAKQVLADAVKAADAASSYHQSAQTLAGAYGNGSDVTIVRGKGLMGSMTFGGQKVDLVVIGSQGYMRAPAGFWGVWVGSTTATKRAGKWFAFPTSNEPFGAMTRVNPRYFDELTSSTGTLTNKGVTTYDGQSVVAIDRGSKGGTLYVAATGDPYPVAIVVPGQGGTVTFGGWNKSVTLTAPSDAIDLSTGG